MNTRCRILYIAAAVLMVIFVTTNRVIATSSSSTHFDASEIQFDSGSSLETCSGSYCASASIGNLAGGEAQGTSKKVTFGNIPANSGPLLEVIVQSGNSDLGVLSQDKTATKTMKIKVRTYKSDGYTLHITGSTPSYKDHALAAPDAPSSSSPGSEQFGLNLARNTTPEVGEDPAQVPSSNFSYGNATVNYSTANLFQYKDGDVVAESLSESGQTDYTVSMIVNISSQTPAGHYSGDLSAVVVPVF